MISYDEAIDLVLKNIDPLEAVKIPLSDAVGHVLAENVPAKFDLPPADNSAMDGYAFAHRTLPHNKVLKVSGFVPAGQLHQQPVATGQAVRIMTGAPLPEGCDTVVPLEDVSLKGDIIELQTVPAAGHHVRLRGEEIKAGATVLSVGSVLTAGSIGLLAAAGRSRVQVHPAPRVAVLSNGDELVELGEIPGAGKVINSNAYMLAARLQEDGFQPKRLGIARDCRENLESCLRKGLACDALISSGGISIGDRDFVQETLTKLGFEKIFWKVAIKPGKPVLFGRIGKMPVFGLPGNPASSAATYELLTRPALRKLAGHPNPLPPRTHVRLLAPVGASGNRQQFIWGKLLIHEGELAFQPSLNGSSGQNRSLHGTQAILPVPIGCQGFKADERVEIIMLRLPEESYCV